MSATSALPTIPATASTSPPAILPRTTAWPCFSWDYPGRRRLKLLGRMRVIDTTEPALLAGLEDPDYPAQVERGFLIEVEAFDWNCPPAHYTALYRGGVG